MIKRSGSVFAQSEDANESPPRIFNKRPLVQRDTPVAVLGFGGNYAVLFKSHHENRDQHNLYDDAGNC